MKARSLWKIGPALLFSLLQLVPLYIALTVALKPQTDLSSYWSLPAKPTWTNFAQALVLGDLPRALVNTIVICATSTVLVVVIGAAAAYPLARHRSRLNAVVRTFILSILMVPALSLLVPLYVLLVKVHGVSTFWGIVPVHVTFNLPLGIFMYSNFVRTIPKELDEAALIDGCSVYKIFGSIILPLLKPVTVSVIILTGVAVWNDFQYSLYFLQKSTMRVLPLAIASFFGLSGADPHIASPAGSPGAPQPTRCADPHIASAAALLAILPVTLLYIFLQRYFVKGVVDSAVK